LPIEQITPIQEISQRRAHEFEGLVFDS